MNQYLQFLREIKSVAFATMDNDRPAVRIADVMLVEDDKLFFLVPRGKAFYKQLRKNPCLSLVGMDAAYKTVRVTGPVEFVSRAYLDKIYEANPMMNELYTREQTDILEAYCMPRGVGDFFDLSTAPPQCERFSFGGEKEIPRGYRINADCTECGICAEACPENCISPGTPYEIEKNCIECGRCYEQCPAEAIEPPFSFRYN